VDREGKYMVSAGADYRVRIWDVRNYKEVHSYYVNRPADVVSLSELGLLGIGWGSHVNVLPTGDKLTLDMERCIENETTISVHET
jgi:WD40 repeat protein